MGKTSDLVLDDTCEDMVSWRVTCTGTQVKQFIPNVPIGVPSTFTLEVTVKDNNTGKPKWVCWNFGVAQMDPEITLAPKALIHARGECNPCAYFAFRADGCRSGKDCDFCHICTKSQAKAKKKAKAKALKAVQDGKPETKEVIRVLQPSDMGLELVTDKSI